MTNAKQITTIAILIAVTSSIATYAFTAQNDPLALIEKENKQAIRECLSSIDYESTSNQILLATETCSKLEIKKITGGNKLMNATGGIAPVPPSKTICTIGTGSHNVRSLAKNYPWVAWWKNNNPSWITLGSKELEKSFDDAWILWTVGTARPSKEWSNYYWFPDLENWMKAKLLIIKRSYKNYSIESYLRVWWTDSINTSLDIKRTITSLSDEELILLTRKQIQKESGSLSNYIFNNVIVCTNPHLLQK